MTDLTPAERETIILTSEADETASVYTFDKRLKVQQATGSGFWLPR